MLSFFCLPPASIFQSLLAVDLVFFSESGVQIPKYSRMKLVLHHSCSVNLSQEQCSDAVGERERGTVMVLELFYRDTAKQGFLFGYLLWQ